jgi:hypothetical protein
MRGENSRTSICARHKLSAVIAALLSRILRSQGVSAIRFA